MKLNTLKSVYNALNEGTNTVEIDEAKRKRALLPLERMLELAK